ncbi:MAG: GyrI-like domain-containing protein [Candidatus Limnocylindrales bacterium]
MATTATADLKKMLAPLFNPPRNPVLVDVPELGYLMIDGKGAPEEDAEYPTTDFQQAIAALYPMAYTIKFRLKRDGLAMPVLPLEALWFTGEDEAFDMNVAPENWSWRALIAVSDDVTPHIFEEAMAEVRRKKGDSDQLARLRFERWREGRCAQVMHIGPYTEERPTIERLHAFIAAQGLKPRGAHHEIYLGDPRRGDPAKLKTALRQPVGES